MRMLNRSKEWTAKIPKGILPAKFSQIVRGGGRRRRRRRRRNGVDDGPG
jgi:hypothetical protein